MLQSVFLECIISETAFLIRNSISLAAYEGARHGILPGKTAENVRQIVQQSIDTIGVVSPTIVVTPATITEDSPQMTVSITVPMNENQFAFSELFADRRVVATCTLTRESAVVELSGVDLVQ